MSLIHDYTYQLLQEAHLADLRAEAANDRLARLAMEDQPRHPRRPLFRWSARRSHRLTRHPSIG